MSYLCESCGKGQVQQTKVKNFEVKLFDCPFTIKTANIEVCDHCGEKSYDAKELHRWQNLYKKWEEKTNKHFSPSDIIRIRKRLRLTQSEFAKVIGVSRQSLINWEKEGSTATHTRSVEIILRLLDNDPISGGDSNANEILKFAGIEASSSEPSETQGDEEEIPIKISHVLYDSLSKSAENNRTDLNSYLIHLLTRRDVLECVEREITTLQGSIWQLNSSFGKLRQSRSQHPMLDLEYGKVG